MSQRSSNAPAAKLRRQTSAEFAALQRQAATVIMRPLGPDWRTQRRWSDGRRTAEIVESFIKPNDRLTSLERIEIYNRQYWFRLIDSLYDDFPGLLAVMGQRKFSRFVRAYLAKYPSRSFTMRNLGSHLPRMLIDEPNWAEPRSALAQDMAAFEWAQVIAFDSAQHPPLQVDDLLGADPSRLKLGLQPYLTLLDLRYPLDDFSLAVKRRIARSMTSNSAEETRATQHQKRISLPRPKHTFVAVHRVDNAIYYKRLSSGEFALLTDLRDGATLARACMAAVKADRIALEGSQLSQWFKQWATLGWFCASRQQR
jgi:hypothetical protein